jgi:5'-nucleotidase/UDP-sugar diphosphatase
MEKISRRKFLKSSMAIGAGAMLMVYSDGTYVVKAAQETPDFRMRVLHTNDHHARIEPVLSGGEPVHGGVSRRKTLIDGVRNSETLPVMLVDAGDVFQGTLYFNEYSGMADLEFYNAMGYEAMAIGNHEFDKTQFELANFINAATFPVLSANINIGAASPLSGLVKPYTIIEKGGKKIGIFSLTAQDTPELALGARDNLEFTDPIAAAQAQVAALQAQGVFTIIGLTHVGIRVDREIARQVSGISMIIGGHSHTPMGPMDNAGDPPYPELIVAPDGKPVVVVTDWEWGRWLGDMTLSFNSAGTVIDIQGNPTEVLPSLDADQGFENRIAVLSAPLDTLRSTVIGSTSVELDGARSNIRSQETNLGNLIADALLDATRSRGAQIAITNGGGIRTTIPAGPITVGQVLEVLPFGNTLTTVDITGAQVIEALENGVSQVEDGSGRFPQISGFSFTFDPARPSGSRVTSASYNGAAMDPNATFRVVTNNYMLSGGDGYTVFAQGSNQLDSGLLMADVVQVYITANSPISLAVDGRIAQGAGSAVAPAPATGETPAEPAPIPATLPNTGPGILQPLGMLASLGASALAGGLALRRRARVEETVEDTETVE